VPILPALPAATDVSFYGTNEVPHGRVEIVQYTTAAGTEKRMHVYLPSGYETDTARRYPVLYLNHGGGENDSHWTVKGFTHCILDNLIAAGRARPKSMEGSCPQRRRNTCATSCRTSTDTIARGPTGRAVRSPDFPWADS
jgi:enterochelin esterase-like enzyme